MRKIKYILYIVPIFSISWLFSSSFTFASENIDTNVNVEPSLTLSVSANTLNLNLDPSSVTFGYNDLDVIVGTNNETGYVLTMSTTSTDLVNTAENSVVIETLPSLSGGYTDSTFIVNKWGYKKNRNTDNYNSFPLTETLLENSTRTNEDVANLRFATKIDYLQESGTYTTAISFNAVANPLLDYIQDLTTTICQEKASSANYTVLDKRDGQEYTVRYINGNCWMTQNLRYMGDTIGSTSTTSTWYLKSATSNVDTDTTISITDLTSDSPVAYNTYDYAKYHDSGDTTTGVWYNYAAVSAMTITAGGNSTLSTQNICPYNWDLPNYSQFNSITPYTSDFSPIASGKYYNGKFYYDTMGFWTSSQALSGNRRYHLRYDGTGLYTNYTNEYYNDRTAGSSVRCILKTS
ncbi:hypothetical protein IJG92_00300 [Candidatus Saccharibacteria bacterium]|nr:hypothetical protein [Candidatus Saccharibacteria bacterium]